MEIYLDIIQLDKVKIELSASREEGCSVTFTITDEDNRRILRSSIMDQGKLKIYSTADEALKDAVLKLTPRAKEHPDSK